jgi:hypothetical protein
MSEDLDADEIAAAVRDGNAAYLLSAYANLRRERDAALAREARLATAAAEVVRQVLGDDPSWWTPERRPDAATMVTTKTLGLYDALTDPTATTWLADRERAAAVRTLRWAATRVMNEGWLPSDSYEAAERWASGLADAIEAGTEEVP